MLKKVLGISMLAGLTAVLIFGAINRTLARNISHSTSGQAVKSNFSRQAQGHGAGQRSSQPGLGNRLGNSQPSLSSGNTQAQVEDWISLEGYVTSADTSQVLVSLLDGETADFSGRAWTFAQESGFALQMGDRLRLTGFYEDTDLEVGSIDNLTSGISIQIREQSGRPLWAGRG